MTTESGSARAVEGDAALALLEQMIFIRRFEERMHEYGAHPDMAGTVIHTAVGQEASAVGAAGLRRPGDILFSTHRGTAHCLAWGIDPVALLAESVGRVGG